MLLSCSVYKMGEIAAKKSPLSQQLDAEGDDNGVTEERAAWF